jgi:hypothetical protein
MEKRDELRFWLSERIGRTVTSSTRLNAGDATSTASWTTGKLQHWPVDSVHLFESLDPGEKRDYLEGLYRVDDGDSIDLSDFRDDQLESMWFGDEEVRIPLSQTVEMRVAVVFGDGTGPQASESA